MKPDRRSDKCRSWYIADCIDLGEHRDRPPSPPVDSLPGELDRKPASAHFYNPIVALADTLPSPVGEALCYKLDELLENTVPGELGDTLVARLGCTLAGELACTLPLEPVHIPLDKQDRKLHEEHRNNFLGEFHYSSVLLLVWEYYCTLSGEHIGTLLWGHFAEFAYIAASPLGTVLVCTPGGTPDEELRGTLDSLPVEEHTYTLPGELDAEHHSIVPWAPGEECPRRLRLFLAVAHFGILRGALGDQRSGIPPSLVDEVLCCIHPVRLGDTLLSLLDAAPLWGYLGNFLSLLVEVLARVPARTLPEELDCKRREELVWPRDYRPLWVLGYSFPFLVVEEHLGIPLWLPVGILLAAHREECYSNLSTPLGDKLA